jgi:NAD(P)-dependent dehydrogenase (short-subunit alcohol dehydrogenase family)
MKLNSSVAAGASGLGAATSRALAAHGVKVAIFDFNEEKGEAVEGNRVDVTSDQEVDAAFAKARAAHGQERILVNCAGTGNAVKTAGRDKNTGEATHFPLDAFNRIIQINLVGTFRGMRRRACCRCPRWRTASAVQSSIPLWWRLRTARWGRPPIRHSKGGVVGMTLPIARDLMNEGIRVNTILPGIFNTPLLRGARTSRPPSALRCRSRSALACPRNMRSWR